VWAGKKKTSAGIAFRLAADGAAVVVNGRGDRAIIETTAKENRRVAAGRAVPLSRRRVKARRSRGDGQGRGQGIRRRRYRHRNAGLRRQTSFLQMSLDEWHEILSVALDGAFILARRSCPR